MEGGEAREKGEAKEKAKGKAKGRAKGPVNHLKAAVVTE